MRKISRALQLGAAATAGALLLGGGFAFAGDVISSSGDEAVEEVEDVTGDGEPGGDAPVEGDAPEAEAPAEEGTTDDGTGGEGTTEEEAAEEPVTDELPVTDGDDTGVPGTNGTEEAPVAEDPAQEPEHRNHGQRVSEVARTTPGGPGKGQIVSAVARDNQGRQGSETDDGDDGTYDEAVEDEDEDAANGNGR